jgi:hypothetical protein
MGKFPRLSFGSSIRLFVASLLDTDFSIATASISSKLKGLRKMYKRKLEIYLPNDMEFLSRDSGNESRRGLWSIYTTLFLCFALLILFFFFNWGFHVIHGRDVGIHTKVDQDKSFCRKK